MSNFSPRETGCAIAVLVFCLLTAVLVTVVVALPGDSALEGCPESLMADCLR